MSSDFLCNGKTSNLPSLEVAKKVNKSIPVATNLNWLLHIYYARQDFDTCRNLISSQLEVHFNPEYLYFVKGLIERHEGNYFDALRDFQKAIDINPRNVENFKEIGKTLYIMGRLKQALEVFREAENMINRPDHEIFHYIGELLYRNNNNPQKCSHLSEAKEYFQKAVLHGKKLESYQKLAEMYRKEKDYSKAIEILESCLQIAPDNTEVLSEIGVLYLKVNDPHNAFNRLLEVTSINDKCPRGLIAFGAILQSRNDVDGALNKYKGICGEEHEGPELWNNIGLCFYKKKKLIVAIACLRKSIWLSPMNYNSLYNLSLVLITVFCKEEDLRILKCNNTQSNNEPKSLNRYFRQKAKENHDFIHNLIMGDEAHFHLNRLVNKENCRIWATENPRVVHQRQLHPLKCTVSCGVSSERIIGPYFFENEHGAAVSINGGQYRMMLENFLCQLWKTINNYASNRMEPQHILRGTQWLFYGTPQRSFRATLYIHVKNINNSNSCVQSSRVKVTNRKVLGPQIHDFTLSSIRTFPRLRGIISVAVSPRLWQNCDFPTQQFASAFLTLAAAINLRPNSAECYMLLGICLRKLQDLDNAYIAFERASMLPDALKNPLIYLNFALFCYETGKKEKASTNFNNFLKMSEEMVMPTEYKLYATKLKALLPYSSKGTPIKQDIIDDGVDAMDSSPAKEAEAGGERVIRAEHFSDDKDDIFDKSKEESDGDDLV